MKQAKLSSESEAVTERYGPVPVVLTEALAYFPRCARARAVRCKLVAIWSWGVLDGSCHGAKIARPKRRLMRSSCWALSG